MPLIFRYFWFVCAAFMLVNLFIWKRRLSTVVERGVVTQAEVDQFIRGATIGLVEGPILLGIINVYAGWSWPLCSGVLLFTDVPRTLVSVIVLSGWAALLWWVWRRNGADFIARVYSALDPRAASKEAYSPRIVRLAVTAMVLVSSVGAVVTSRTMPVVPGMECPPSTVR